MRTKISMRVSIRYIAGPSTQPVRLCQIDVSATYKFLSAISRDHQRNPVDWNEVDIAD